MADSKVDPMEHVGKMWLVDDVLRVGIVLCQTTLGIFPG
jgi:hypothetical protein